MGFQQGREAKLHKLLTQSFHFICVGSLVSGGWDWRLGLGWDGL